VDEDVTPLVRVAADEVGGARLEHHEAGVPGERGHVADAVGGRAGRGHVPARRDAQLAVAHVDARRTVTFDRGTEFAAYPELARELDVASYFCDPHSPWQKGSVENTNGRVRRFLPRHCEPEALARARLRPLADRLNDTPRRCLGYRTPREVFDQHLAAPTGPP